MEGTRALPLYEACRCGTACWRDEPEDAFQPPERAGIPLPWIGTDYRAGGVCVTGINMNDYGGIFAHWALTGGYIEALERGKRQPKGSPLPLAAGCYAHAVACALRGEPLQQPVDDPLLAAQGWRASCHLELVKCSPRRERSNPNAAMWTNCSPLYLADELARLEPGVLVVLGIDDATERVRRLGRERLWKASPYLERGEIELGDRTFEVFGVQHPSARGRDGRAGWKHSYAALVEALREAAPST